MLHIYIYIYIYDISSLRVNDLTLILLTWRKWWAGNNASKWQMGFNSAFKGLITVVRFGTYVPKWLHIIPRVRSNRIVYDMTWRRMFGQKVGVLDRELTYSDRKRYVTSWIQNNKNQKQDNNEKPDIKNYRNSSSRYIIHVLSHRLWTAVQVITQNVSWHPSFLPKLFAINKTNPYNYSSQTWWYV